MAKNLPSKWRRRIGKRDCKKLRKVLAVMLILECLYGITGMHSWRREWQPDRPDAGGPAGDIYGIRLDGKSWELQFYHTRQSINDH